MIQLFPLVAGTMQLSLAKVVLVFQTNKRPLWRNATMTGDSSDLKKSIKIRGGRLSDRKCALRGSQDRSSAQGQHLV